MPDGKTNFIGASALSDRPKPERSMSSLPPLYSSIQSEALPRLSVKLLLFWVQTSFIQSPVPSCSAAAKAAIQGIEAIMMTAAARLPIFLINFIKIPLSVFNDKLIISYPTVHFNIFVYFVQTKFRAVFW